MSNEDILATLSACTLRELCQYRAELLRRRQSARAIFGHANSPFTDSASPGNQEYTALVRLTDLVKVAIARKPFETPTGSRGSKDGSAKGQASGHDKTADEKLTEQSGTPVKAAPKRGPKPDYRTACKVADIIEQVAAGANWHSELDDICWELDGKRVGQPKPWKRKGYADWTACLSGERQLVVKAIEHHLKLAKQYRETIS
jgi:hypothetical protein